MMKLSELNERVKEQGFEPEDADISDVDIDYNTVLGKFCLNKDFILEIDRLKSELIESQKDLKEEKDNNLILTKLIENIKKLERNIEHFRNKSDDAGSKLEKATQTYKVSLTHYDRIKKNAEQIISIDDNKEITKE
ncbi:hypothetical protein KAU15_02715 [candidate division WOR-3 bacterium]|nr:hypothetical protein [candidate division WOR-3 bacterium]